MSTIKKTCVAIPVGGKVNLAYLQETFETLKQTDAVIYVGLDEAESLTGLGNYDDVRSLCEQYADKVMLFPRESYYRPGGIWKKILDCWEDSNCEFLRGIGYDDLLPPPCIQQQQSVLENNTSLAACYANQVIQYDEDVAGRQIENTYLSPLKRLLAIGKNPFSFICWTVRREAILTKAFYENTLKGSAAWEWLFHATLLGANSVHCNTAFAATPIRREHTQTISSQYLTMTPEQQKKLHEDIFAITQFNATIAVHDWHSLKMLDFYKQQRQMRSPFLGRMVNMLPYTEHLES